MTNIFSAYSGTVGSHGLLLSTHIETTGKLALVVEPHHVNGRGVNGWRYTVALATDYGPATVASGHYHRRQPEIARERALAAGRDALAEARRAAIAEAIAKELDR